MTRKGERSTPVTCAVVVVTYNSENEIDACLSALHAAVGGDASTKVIVVDNASSDGTVGVLQRAHAWVTRVESATNTGFPGGCNAGIRAAIGLGCEFVYLLNPDTEVEPDFLREALAIATLHPRAAAVQSLLLLAGSDPELVNTAGNEIQFLGFGHCGSFRRPSTEIGTEPLEIAFASGASVLYRIAALQEIGLFDEDLFLYQEDMDVGIRVRLAGWSAMLAPRSRVQHHYRFHRGAAKYYWLERNRVLVLAKNLELRTLIALAPGLVLADLAVALAAARQGWLKEKVRANLHMLKPNTWRHILRGREQMRNLRRVPDSTLVEAFTPRLDFEGVMSPVIHRAVNPAMTAVWSVIRRLIS